MRAKIVKLLCEFISRKIQGMRNQCPIARPHVIVCISIEIDRIRIVCSNNASAIIDLSAANQETSFVLPRHFFR